MMAVPLKVTFCTTDGWNSIGGINAWLLQFLPELKAAGFDVRLIVFAWSPPDLCASLRKFNDSGIECQTVDFQLRTEDAVRRTLELLASAPPDVFVPNMVVPALYAARWASEAGIPTVGVLQNDDDYYKAIVRQFGERRKRWQLSHFVHISSGLGKMAREGNAGNSGTSLIPYGVRLPQTVATKPADNLRLIYVGRIVEEQKRVFEMARAFLSVTRQVQNVEADIYGSGPDEDALAELLRREGNGLPVRLHGRIDVDEVPAVLSKAHVFVLLSDYEGLGLAVLEAMASGLVPICLNTASGVPDFVLHETTGLLVKNRDEAFLEAVVRLKASSELWLRLAGAARQKVSDEFSPGLCVQRWAELLIRLATESSGQKAIGVPQSIVLPPPDSGFGWNDNRPHPLWRRGLRRIRKLARCKFKFGFGPIGRVTRTKSTL